MQRVLLKSKIHRARVTGTVLEYEGSITVDASLLDAAGIVHFEQVHVLNLNSGNRIITYAIEGRRGSGMVELNGPAARHGQAGDEVVILSYGVYGERERPHPRIVLVGPGNLPVKSGKARR